MNTRLTCELRIRSSTAALRAMQSSRFALRLLTP
jgi:hypothetical protein